MVKVDDSMRKFIHSYKSIWLVTTVSLSSVIALYAFSAAVYLNRSPKDSSDNTSHATRDNDSLISKLYNESHLASTNSNAGGKIGKYRTVDYQGVSFKYNVSLASEIKAEIKPASALQYETDTGEGVVPEYIAFQPIGTYTSQHEASFFSPEIDIYPIATYKTVLAKSKSYTQKFEGDIRTLRAMLSEQPPSIDKKIPLLPFGIGASQVLRARVKYINFQNGRGVMFLTQYNIEPALINNQGLTYTFQGLTDDGVYYVSAIFPVTAPFLPESYDIESTEGYTLVPPRSFQGREYESFENDYAAYIARVISKLERLPDESYQPNLAILEDLIQSLKVQKPCAQPCE